MTASVAVEKILAIDELSQPAIRTDYVKRIASALRVATRFLQCIADKKLDGNYAQAALIIEEIDRLFEER